MSDLSIKQFESPISPIREEATPLPTDISLAEIDFPNSYFNNMTKEQKLGLVAQANSEVAKLDLSNLDDHDAYRAALQASLPFINKSYPELGHTTANLLTLDIRDDNSQFALDGIRKEFYDQGLFINTNLSRFGQELLIPIEKVGEASENHPGITAIFGERSGTREVTVLNSPNFIPNGLHTDGKIYLNVINAVTSDDRLQIPESADWAKMTERDLFRSTLVNEMTHAILTTDYNFNSSKLGQWQNQGVGIGATLIPSNTHVHELISDAVSINEHPGAIATFLPTSLYQLRTDDEGNIGIDYKDQYAVSKDLLLTLVAQEIEKNGGDFRAMLTEYIKQMHSLSKEAQVLEPNSPEIKRIEAAGRALTRDFTYQTLSYLDANNAQTIQNRFATIAKGLVGLIENGMGE
jgi:hypothetical protein